MIVNTNQHILRLILLLLFFRNVSTTVSCPGGFIPDTSSPPICYLYLGSVTFQSTLNLCPLYSNSTLPIFRKESELYNAATVIRTLLGNANNIWLGLVAQPSMTSTSFSWTDGTPKTFEYWEASYPANVDESCVKMHDPSHAQMWVTDKCTNYNSYVCQLRTTTNCPINWTPDSSTPPICYLVGLLPTINYNEAFDYCNSHGATLPIFRSYSEQVYAVTLFDVLNINNVWIGLTAPSIDQTINSNSYSWIDNSIRYFDHWESNPTDPKLRCVKTNDTNHNLSWVATDCYEINTLVCQFRTSSICAAGYIEDAGNKFCYLFSDNLVTAQKAQEFCQSQPTPSNLPVFNVISGDFSFYIILSQRLNKLGTRWLGASRPCNSSSSSSSFLWMDNTNFTTTGVVWYPSQPDNADPTNSNIQQNCVAVDATSAYWYDWQCNHLFSTVCQYQINSIPIQYQFPIPLCLINTAISCNPLNDPQHGHVAVNSQSYSAGTIAQFTCDPNYNLTGPATITCQSNLNWTNYPPTCQLNPCSPNPCQNGGTCVPQSNGSYTCSCSVSYWGTDCANINYCVVGNFNQPVKRRKRDSPVTGSNMNLQISNLRGNDTTNLSFLDSTVNLLNDTLNALQYLASNLGLPTAQPGNDTCAPNGICILSTAVAKCACTDKFLGPRCEFRNCSAIPWSEWSSCTIHKCEERTGLGQRYRTHVNFTDCYPSNDRHSSCEADCYPPDPMSPTARTVATVSQSFGCTTLVIFVSITFCLFASFRIMSLERMLCMFQEIALFIGHLTLIIITRFQLNETWCSVAAIVLQCSFLTNFTFLFLETLQTYCILQNVLSIGGFFSVKVNLAIGLGVPFALTLLTAMTMFKWYPSKYSCWLNLGNGKIALSTYIPLLAFTVTAVILTEAAAQYDKRRLPLTSVDRYVAALVSQKMAVFKIFFNVLSWVVGMNAIYYQNVALYGSLFIINTVLGVVIFVAHTSSNERVVGYVRSFFCRRKHKH